MSDHHRQQAVERIVTSVRETAEAAMLGYGEAIAVAAADEVRRDAAAHITHLRDTIQRQELTRIDLESQLAEVRRVLDETRRNVADIIAAMESQHAAAVAEATNVRRSLEEAVRRAEETAVAERTRADAAEKALRRVAEVPAAGNTPLAARLDTMDKARSLADVLARLFEATTEQAERAALLLVRNDALSLWRSAGFDANVTALPPQPRMASSSDVLQVAWRDARCVVDAAIDGEGSSLPPFARTTSPRAAVAFPVSVGGEVVAILYADASLTAGTPPPWCDSIETLARYSGRLLASLTIQLARDAQRRVQRPSPRARSGSSIAPGGIR